MAQTATVTYQTAGSAQITAQCEGISSAAIPVTVLASGPPPGGWLAHKPSNYIRFGESSMIGPTAGTNAFGSFSDSNTYNIAGVGFGTDAAEPVSPPGCRTDRLYGGLIPGFGSGATLSGWSNPAIYYKEFYGAWTFKLVQAQYYAGGIYPLTKIGFICYGNDVLGSGNSGIISFRHDGGQTWLTGGCQIGFTQQNNQANHRWNQTDRINAAASPNGMGGVTAAGLGNVFNFAAWNILEHRCILNSAAGVADGVYQQWVNGVMTHDYTNVVYITTGGPHAFGRFRTCDLTWGGGGTGSKPNDEDFRVGHVYMAGIPV